MNIQDMKISTRLALGFGAMCSLIAVLGATTLLTNRSVDHHFHRVINDQYPKVKQVNHIEREINESARALRNVFIMTDPADQRSQFEEVATSDKIIADTFAKLQESIVSDKGKAALDSVLTARAAYKVTRDQVLERFKAGLVDEARTVLLKDMRPAQLAYMQRLEELTKLQDALMVQAASEVAADLKSAQLTVMALLAISLAAGAFLSMWIIRSTTRPLHEAARVARAVAQGDLTQEIADGGRNETGLLLGALHEMQTRLASIVGSVRQNAESVATASAQIAQGNLDLSSRTEEQASALEETAASMEELSSTVKQNADNARQANQLAMGASSVAIKGGDVVGQVVDTMKGINDSSKKIADIISVIDGIAFQTNILALNAAVEAARAGEQGRGFAVVASEVRSLAQRSAEAAKEIKSLINASVERVEQGTTLVDQAGVTMTEVVNAIKRVTDIMGEISSASTEQSAGVAQVGEAITQMDQATQQNAALVEESAAAAESLKNQAHQMVQTVAVFKLSAGSGAGAPAVARPPQPRNTPAARVHVPVAAPRPAAPAARPPIDRRGPNRAQNVARLPVQATPAATQTPSTASAKTGTGGTDEWESF